MGDLVRRRFVCSCRLFFGGVEDVAPYNEWWDLVRRRIVLFSPLVFYGRPMVAPTMYGVVWHAAIMSVLAVGFYGRSHTCEASVL